jgi:hypothetical protein
MRLGNCRKSPKLPESTKGGKNVAGRMDTAPGRRASSRYDTGKTGRLVEKALVTPT